MSRAAIARQTSLECTPVRRRSGTGPKGEEGEPVLRDGGGGRNGSWKKLAVVKFLITHDVFLRCCMLHVCTTCTRT